MTMSSCVENNVRRARGAVLAAALGAASCAASACDDGATALFSCDASGGRKYIELCASSPASGPDAFLEYRFGAQDADGRTQSVELKFPPQRSGSLQRFVGATYTAGGIYTQSVRFETPQASYTVFTESRGMQTTAAGVRVRDLRSGKLVTVACSERPRFYIHELKDVLACDPQTPVGRACIR